MKFLLDENISPKVAFSLAAAGHDAVHVRDLELSRAPDEAVLAAALDQDRVVVSADADFGELLARSNAGRPSVMFLRRQQQRRATEVAALIVANLDAFAADLEAGAIVVLDDHRVFDPSRSTRHRSRIPKPAVADAADRVIFPSYSDTRSPRLRCADDVPVPSGQGVRGPDRHVVVVHDDRHDLNVDQALQGHRVLVSA